MSQPDSVEVDISTAIALVLAFIDDDQTTTEAILYTTDPTHLVGQLFWLVVQLGRSMTDEETFRASLHEALRREAE